MQWRLWGAATSKGDARSGDGYEFFRFIEKEHGHLLEFESPGNKWSVVNCWLMDARLICRD